jgi:hypothetical protein
MKLVPKFALLTVAVLGFSASAFALSPPWVLLQNELKATIGADPHVEVDDLVQVGTSPEKFNLDVHVKGRGEKAQALADFISKEYDFGGVLVDVRVFDRHGDIESPQPIPTNVDDAKDLVRDTLKGNPFFVKLDPPRFLDQFFVEFCKGIVQYPADNISDFYQNNNEVAAEAFDEVLGLASIPGIHIGVATSERKECSVD